LDRLVPARICLLCCHDFEGTHDVNIWIMAAYCLTSFKRLGTLIPFLTLQTV
jgi:hypothetical protein